MSEVLAGIPIVPPAIIVPILVMLSPVPVQSGIQSRISRNDLWDQIRVFHVIVRLSLVKVIHSCLVRRIIRKLVPFPSYGGVCVGMLCRVSKV